jgi:hypothetical protein
MQIQYSLVLRRFVLRRFTFTTLVESNQHSRLVVHHWRNSSVFSLITAFLALSQCTCFSSFSILALLFWVDCDFYNHDVHQKDRKQENIKTLDVTFYLDVFWTTAWAFFNKIKSNLFDIFSNICVIFYIYLIHYIKIVCHNVKKYCKL